jgi:hypothetical protein
MHVSGLEESASMPVSDQSNIKYVTGGPRGQAVHCVHSSCVRRRRSISRVPAIRGGLDVNELIQLVAQRAGISSEQAALAVNCMLAYLTARLPSPVVGRIREQLDLLHSVVRGDGGDGTVT